MNKRQKRIISERTRAWAKLKKPKRFNGQEVLELSRLFVDMQDVIRAQCEYQEWHPIVTAPKDRVIELYLDLGDKFKYAQRAEWGHSILMNLFTIFGVRGGWFDTYRGTEIPFKPTHWRNPQGINPPAQAKNKPQGRK